ncbi:hypothetical protein ACFQE4_28120 [Streptomyces thermocoprophilus]|uniref:DUF4352 domain-containing protein n=1 Tax=Streptomyces thermocoprophilus TaxID=78356 RepID=A0ABV5VBI4_9ACTN
MNHPNLSGTALAPAPSAPRPTAGRPVASPLARARRTLFALAATAVGLSLTACSDIGGGETDNTPKNATVSASQDSRAGDNAADSDDAAGSQDDAGGDSFTVALDKTATWNNGVKARLGGFSRGTSGEWAAPSGTAYLAFSVTVENGSKNALDLNMISLSCPDGGEEIFDSEAGFGGTPDKHLLPGKSQTWKQACAFPKTAKDVQIEITPADTSATGWYRTAIFTGQVK